MDLVNANFHWTRRRFIAMVFSDFSAVQLAGMTIGSFNHEANRRGRNIGEAEMAEMTFPRVVNPLFRPCPIKKALIFISMFDSVSGQDFSYLGSCSLSINAYIFSSTFFQFQWVIYPRFVVEKAGTLTSRDHRAGQGSYPLPRVSTPTRRARSVRSTEFNSTSFVSHAQRSREARGRACCRFPPLRENKSLRVRGENSARW